MRIRSLAVLLFVSCLLVRAHAGATVVQVDGTIIPVMSGSTCEGNLQICFNAEEGVSPPSALAIRAVADAAKVPEVFVPNLTGLVSFKDIAEGAGFENSFGYYNVGDDVTNTANLHPIMGCGVPASTHSGEVPNYVVSAEAGTTTTVDFAAEQVSGRYRGGFIGFYLLTPEGEPGGQNCGDFAGSNR